MKTPVSAATLKQHLTYNWWKYLLVAVIGFFAVDLIYTMTAYRVPEEKKVEFYVYGYANEEALNRYMADVNKNRMPDMESMTCHLILNDETYGSMMLTTYMAAGEGDLYLLPRDQFLSMAAQGALVPLEDNQELMDWFNSRGLSLQNGWRKITETGENHLCGIPQGKVPGLLSCAYAQDGYLCVTVTGGNEENTMKFLNYLVRDMAEAPDQESPAPDQASPAPAQESPAPQTEAAP